MLSNDFQNNEIIASIQNVGLPVCQDSPPVQDDPTMGKTCAT